MASAGPRPARTRAAALALLLAPVVAPACASAPDARDPLEPVNRGLLAVHGLVDGVVIRPAAALYTFFLPAPIRQGVSNVVANATYLDTVLNDLLQGKLVQGGRDLARLLVNTTAGIAGVLDVASGLGLEQHDEDFGQTLASWGLPPGPYLVVPLVGPSTLRDLPGLGVTFLASPVPYLEGGAQLAAGSVWLVDRRARVDPDFERRAREASDPYAFVREAWLRHREHLASDGASAEAEEEARELLEEIEELEALDELDELEDEDR